MTSPYPEQAETLRVVNAARDAMNASTDAIDTINVPAHLAAMLSLALDDYNAALTRQAAPAPCRHQFEPFPGAESFCLTCGFDASHQDHAAPATQPATTTLAARISELIEQHGSLRAAAHALETDTSYLSRLASGEKAVPKDDLLRRMDLRRVPAYARRSDSRDAAGAAQVPAAPTITMYLTDEDGDFGVDLIVTGLRSMKQAEAAMAHMQRLLCGRELKVN